MFTHNHTHFLQECLCDPSITIEYARILFHRLIFAGYYSLTSIAELRKMLQIRSLTTPADISRHRCLRHFQKKIKIRFYAHKLSITPLQEEIVPYSDNRQEYPYYANQNMLAIIHLQLSQ